MKIEVLVTQWSTDGDSFPGGVHEIAKPSKKLLAAIGAAPETTLKVMSASKVERAALDSAVQSQAEGEKAYAAAQKDGSWHEGNYDQFMADVEAGLRDPEVFGTMPDRETYVAERKVS